MKLDAETVIDELAALFHEKFHSDCERHRTFPWLKNQGKLLVAVAYFSPPLNCLFMFDESRRLNRDRGRTLAGYSHDAPLGFNFSLYEKLCAANRSGSTLRSRMWAEEDVALDLLPPKHGLNPTLRLAEAELRDKLNGKFTKEKLRNALVSLLEKRFNMHAGTTFLQLLEHPSGKPFTPRTGLKN